MNQKYKIGFLIFLGILIGVILTLSTLFIIDNKKINSNNLTIENKKDKMKTEVNKKNKEEKNDEKAKTLINENSDNNYRIDTDTSIIESKDQTINNADNSNNEIVIQSIDTDNSEIDISDNNKTNYSIDSEVFNYLEEKKNEISLKIKDGTYKEKAKNIFIEIVDFLFYDGTIKGYKFSELTSKGKLEIIKIAIKIEDKIEEYQPGLIDSIGGKYINVKSKIINLYTSKTNEYCNDNHNLCNNVREDYNKIKNTFTNAFGNLKNNISNYYQNNIKGSN